MNLSLAGALCLFIVTLYLHEVSSDVFVKDGKSHHAVDREPAVVCDNSRMISWISLTYKNSLILWEMHLSTLFD